MREATAMLAGSAAIRTLDRLSQRQAIALAVLGVAVVGAADYFTGYELAFSLFYLGPVAAAAWRCGRRAAVAIALLSSLVWSAADLGAGHVYAHPGIAAWNASIRLGFFLITGLLLVALRERLATEERLARTDSLTGLLNRRAFFERLEYVLQLARRNARELTLIYVDLDEFKAINDHHGHAAGDEVLRAAASALAESIRSADTAARLGGDEFALLLVETDRRGAEELISKLRGRLREVPLPGGRQFACSIGSMTFCEPPDSADGALRAADALMYRVKASGKNGTALEEAGGRPQAGRSGNFR